MAKTSYHHGDLRRALLAEAAVVIAESGVAALSLRDLARRVGVSHAAPAHHFGDKAGLLTAFATEGYGLLATELAGTDSFLEMGVAYVRFARAHPAHFEVMFRPDLYHAYDAELLAARRRTAASLYAGAATLAPGGTPSPGGAPSPGGTSSPGGTPSPGGAASPGGAPSPAGGSARVTGLAAWSLAHGLATLSLSGSLPDLGPDPDEAARMILGQLRPD